METESIDSMRDRMDWEENNPGSPVVRMLCSVCGARTTGRQWWSRDTGFGLCEDCNGRMGLKYTAEDMERLYGKAGFHHSIQEN